MESTGTQLYSFSPLPLLVLASLTGGEAVSFLKILKSFDMFELALILILVIISKLQLRRTCEVMESSRLANPLGTWGHPRNMAVVLFAMGGYGTYLGFRIRFSDCEKAMAKALHPKLIGGMFFFFALGATGGATSLLTSDKSIFESPHDVTGFIGLTLLTVQTILPALFDVKPRWGESGIAQMFLVHAALWLQLGLSY